MASHSLSESTSYVIRQEIARFESVHPSIYAIYDLIENIDDKSLADALRQLVVSIEDAFVNSQEWTLSFNVPDIKLVNNSIFLIVHEGAVGDSQKWKVSTCT
ncbi:unnamed protein product [Protopolystoma xenopodis]|uniref:Uncharacterized protein n=1 Tax=Protopolystoma xenopodis TaxID=117903 RepID=A0A3S5CQ26_9PLAT|nr:unnamed protein product [Protopolystoma xenopodis]